MKKPQRKLGIFFIALIVGFSLGCKGKQAQEQTKAQSLEPKKEPPKELLQEQKPEAIPEAPKVEPAKQEREPAIFLFYKSDTPDANKYLKGGKLEMTAGEEIPISLQVLDAKGIEVFSCPSWQADSALSFKPVENYCRGIKLKALKPAQEATLTAVFKTAGNKEVKPVLKVEVKAK